MKCSSGGDAVIRLWPRYDLSIVAQCVLFVSVFFSLQYYWWSFLFPKKKILFSFLFASKSNYYHHHHHGSTLRLLPAPSMMIIIIFIYSYHYHIIIIRSINHWRFHFFFIWNHLNDKSLEIRLKFQWKVTVNIISVDSNKTTSIQHLSNMKIMSGRIVLFLSISFRILLTSATANMRKIDSLLSWTWQIKGMVIFQVPALLSLWLRFVAFRHYRQHTHNSHIYAQAKWAA